MDPDIEEKWKAAVMPVALGVIDGYEVSEKGKVEARTRLSKLGVPVWAIQLREYLLERLATGHIPFLPTFAIRVEVAVAGIGCVNPLPEDRLAAHRLVLARFFNLVLVPIVQRIKANDTRETRQEYATLLALFQFLGRDTSPLDLETWRTALRRLEQQTLEHHPRTRADYMPYWGIRILQAGIIQPYDEMDTGLINRFLFQLGGEYEICYQEEGSQMERIAKAFLAALETQCPEPDWLPRFDW